MKQTKQKIYFVISKSTQPLINSKWTWDLLLDGCLTLGPDGTATGAVIVLVALWCSRRRESVMGGRERQRQPWEERGSGGGNQLPWERRKESGDRQGTGPIKPWTSCGVLQWACEKPSDLGASVRSLQHLRGRHHVTVFTATPYILSAPNFSLFLLSTKIHRSPTCSRKKSIKVIAEAELLKT